MNEPVVPPAATVRHVRRQRHGRSLAEDAYVALRDDVLRGRRLPGSRLQVNELAEEHGVSLGVVREALTRLAAEGLLEANPQRGFRVRSLSLAHLEDLTWTRTQIETLALRESIASGDLAWEGALVAAHHRLANTPMFLAKGVFNGDWMSTHGQFHAALVGGASRPALEQIRRSLYDESELYRYWSGTLPAHPVRLAALDEHTAICDAALARDAERACELLAEHLASTAREVASVVRADGSAPNPGTSARQPAPTTSDPCRSESRYENS